MDKKKILGDISTKNKYYLGKKLFFISYKKGIILILILRPYQTLLVFGFFRSCAAQHFIVHRIVMPLLSYRTSFCE